MSHTAKKYIKLATSRIKKAPRSRKIIVGLAVVMLLACMPLAGGLMDGERAASVANRPDPTDSRIGTDDEVLKAYIRAYGVDKTIGHVKTLPVDCHQRIHKVGRFSYELNGDDAFKVINSECMSGYTHGVTEAYFHKHGTENLNKSLELICQGEQNGFYAHQCFHGVGHGLMAYNDYDLPAALQGCDTLPSISTSYESCYSGVFMENVVGAISVEAAKSSANPGEFHTSSWLSNDPLYPCNAVEDTYKNACYIFQTSRMVQIFTYDYQKVAVACASIEPAYRYSCFQSMGRDVSNSFQSDYPQVEKACSYVTDNQLRLSCISGAAQDKFWHESEQDDAIGMCKTMEQIDAKQTCYTTISARGSEIIPTKEISQAFCAKYEPAYAHLCVVKS